MKIFENIEVGINKLLKELEDRILTLSRKVRTYKDLEEVKIKISYELDTFFTTTLHNKLLKLMEEAVAQEDEKERKIIYENETYILRKIISNYPLKSELEDFRTELMLIIRRELTNPEGTTLERIRRKIEEKVGEFTENISTLIRNIFHETINEIRETYFQEENKRRQEEGEEELKFKWIGPDDYRTTEVCRRIKERTRNGVTLEELKRVVREEAIRGGFGWFYSELRPFTPHPNCRHTFIPAV